MTEDALAALRAKAKPPAPRDRKDRVDATLAPDARKARDIVRAVATTDDPASVPLAEIARSIAKVTADSDARHLLEDRVEAFLQASAIYRREELQAPEQPIAWMGDRNGSLGVNVPPGWPEHRILLGAAWGALLRVVNEATKTGVQKRSKYAPIELITNPDAAPLQQATPEWN